jgi:hypothetical protein
MAEGRVLEGPFARFPKLTLPKMPITQIQYAAFPVSTRRVYACHSFMFCVMVSPLSCCSRLKSSSNVTPNTGYISR